MLYHGCSYRVRENKSVDFRFIVLQLLVTLYVLYIFSYQPAWIHVLQLSVIYLHEAGHALAAIFTGGAALSLAVHDGLGGECETQGGSLIAVCLAGYLTTALIGALLLITSKNRTAGRIVSFTLFGGMLALFFVPHASGITARCAVFFCFLWFATGCVSTLMWPLGSLALRFLGTFLCLFSVFDVIYDCFGDSWSDAHAAAQALALPSETIALFFASVCILLFAASFLLSLPAD